MKKTLDTLHFVVVRPQGSALPAGHVTSNASDETLLDSRLTGGPYFLCVHPPQTNISTTEGTLG
jgi:hypothetical protein